MLATANDNVGLHSGEGLRILFPSKDSKHSIL